MHTSKKITTYKLWIESFSLCVKIREFYKRFDTGISAIPTLIYSELKYYEQ